MNGGRDGRLKHECDASCRPVLADQLVRFFDFFEREGLRDDRRDAFLPHQFKRLRDLGGIDVARRVQF